MEHNHLDGRLAAGAISRDGFLGTDDRSLEEIIRDDLESIRTLGLTLAGLLDVLEPALDVAMADQGKSVPLSDCLSVRFTEAMGRIACPFGTSLDGPCGVLPKGQALVTDRSTNEEMVITPLSVHLGRAHGFFQGKGSPYRIEPAQVARMFGLG